MDSLATPEPQPVTPPPVRCRSSIIQFSLRRMLLAVALFAAILGMCSLYGKRSGMFDSDRDATWWWLAVMAFAFAVSGILLVGRRPDVLHFGTASLWAIGGVFIGSMLSAHQQPEFAIPGGVIGCLAGSVVYHLCPPSRVPRDR